MNCGTCANWNLKGSPTRAAGYGLCKVEPKRDASGGPHARAAHLLQEWQVRQSGRRDDRSAGKGAGMTAKQGHCYDWKGHRVIALEGGEYPRVCVIDPAWQWVSPPVNVDAKELQPLPMKYYGGSLP